MSELKLNSLINKNLLSENNKEFFLFSIVGLVLIFLLNLFWAAGLGLKGLLATLVLSLTIVTLFNFELIFYFFLILIFLPYLTIVHQSIFFSFFLLLSALINFRGNILHSVKNPVLVTLCVYFISVIPSLINTPALLLSLRDMLNLLALFIVFIVTLLAFYSKNKMMSVLYFFIIAVFLHSLVVVYLGITSSLRVFGILGVYYIDFAGLGSIMSFILILYSRGFRRIMFSSIFVIITLGLIITQTRNAWISTYFAMFTLLIFLFCKGKFTYTKRSSIFAWIIGSFMLITAIFLLAENYNSNIENRLGVDNQVQVTVNDPTSFGGNSFVTRAMIWQTSVMAFLKHPVIGIGCYAFRHVSNMYYTIPKVFYKLYVEGRTPHITYLQVITETGIIGLIGFLFFIYSIVKFMIMTLRLNLSRDDIVRTLIIIWSFVYIIFSMFMTESWLYGQYIVWIGVLLGFLVNNFKLITINTIEN